MWTTYPHFRGRSSKPKALVEWARLDAATRTAMPQAAARYRAEGREPKMDCGAKALELWLRDARYLDWLPAAPADPAAAFAPAPGRPPLGPTATSAAYRWPGPADLHAAIISTCGEAFAASYLDPSDWRDEDHTILTRTDLAAERLNEEARGVLKAFGARAEKGSAGQPPS